MSDDLIPSSTPKVGSNNQTAANKSDKKRKPSERQAKKWFGLTEAKQRELWAFVVLVPWVWNDLLDSHRFTKLCLLAISLAVAQKVIFSFFKPRLMSNALWLISLIPVAAVVWINSRPEPKPHFTVSLQIGDSGKSIVLLTNECLFFTNFDIPFSIHGSNASPDVKACLIIPIQPGETNEVLNFVVENDSSVEVNDLEFSVTLPKSWNCLADPKWHNGNFFVKQTSSSLEHANIKNLQTWWIPVPWVVFPDEPITFPPITNTCVIPYSDWKTKGGIMLLEIHSTDFTNFIVANTVLFPSSSNAFKPFVTTGRLDANGLLHFSISSDELDDSQK